MEIKPGYVRLVLVRVEWRKTIGWVIRQAVPTHGWLRVLYGMDIWLGRVPLIRTMIAINILAWMILWFMR